MSQKNALWKKLSLGIFLFLTLLLLGEILLLAIESQTPSFKDAVQEISELIPAESSKVILLTELESESRQLLNHNLIKQFKKLKMTREILTSRESRPYIEGVKTFEKYSGLDVDLNLFFRFFGHEGAIAKIDKDILVISKVSQMTLFLKQLAQTVSEKILNKDIKSKNYQGIQIDSLTFARQRIHFTFIGDYAFASNNEKRIANVIQFAKGNKYPAITSVKGFSQALLQTNKKKYPIFVYVNKQLNKKLTELKGSDRWNNLFSGFYWKIAFQEKKVKFDYQYIYSDYSKKNPLNAIASSKKSRAGIYKAFPNATAFYLASSQFNSEKLYDWFYNSWLTSDDERYQFKNIMNDVEDSFRVNIKRLIQEEFKNEVAIAWTGIGYQGFNPFPKLAFVVKVSKYAKPEQKMARLFKYLFNYHRLKKEKSHGVTIRYFKSNNRFGYNYYTRNRDNTSKNQDFSPSFAYTKGYLIVTFSKNTLNAILYYLKGGKGLDNNKTYLAIQKSTMDKYPFTYYIQTTRLKELLKDYLNNSKKNYPAEFMNADALNRLTPLVDLLEEIKGAGGGFKPLDNQIKGELLIKLQ